ncbi:MAG: MFS transporter [Novosphingobium sp.]|nr:MFS transporter [Novosphingobium sp.]
MTSEAWQAGVLVHSRPLRLFTLFILYVAQGVPIGLFWFAVPAWMASNGAKTLDVGYVLAMTSLPWTLKLFNGFIMDRYAFLPMGRRRAWIIGAQSVMIALMLGAAVIQPGVNDVTVLAAIGFAVNLATTFQDVAVDGMAVDIMQEEERARGSGMMFGGQAIGASLSTALTGFAISRLGPAAAYLLSASVIALITLYVVWLRERDGERRLPWSTGQTHERNARIHIGAWRPIITNTFKAMLSPVSLIWLPALLSRGFHYGVLAGATPIIGAQELSWSEEQVTALVGTAQLAAGIAGLTIGGWIGDRFGARNATIGVYAAYIALNVAMILGTAFWGDVSVFRMFVFAWLILDTLLTVVALPISMRLCDPRVAATQFCLYMAMSNLGITLGAWTLSLSDVLGGLPVVFAIMVGWHVVGMLILIFVHFPDRSAEFAQVASQLPEGEGPEPVHN